MRALSPSSNPLLPLASLALATTLGACAARTAPPPGAATQPDLPPGHPPIGTSTTSPHHRHGADAHTWALPSRVVEAKRGDVVEEDAFYADLLQARAVYVAEVHDNPHDHAAQLAIIAGLYARDHALGIGLEMVKRPFQPVLDAYLAGELDEAQLEEQTEWEDRWGFDFEIYRPIFTFAKAHQVHLYALNAPDEVTDAVGKGGLAALTPEARATVPELDLSNAAHRAIVREAFDGHHTEGRSFEDFYTAQVIWDETMADGVARALAAPGAPKRLVVLAGDGHVRHGYGIPSRAARRGVETYRVIIPTMADELDADRAEGGCDYFWVMGETPDARPSTTTAQRAPARRLRGAYTRG